MKRIVVTTAQKSASPNKGLLRNLETFIKHNKITDVYIFAVKGKYKHELVKIKDGEEPKRSDKVRCIKGVEYKQVEVELKPEVLALAEEGIAGAEVHILHSTRKSGLIINKNLRLFHSQMLPQVVNPLLGLASKLPRTASYIVNGTKVRSEPIPSNNFSPRQLFTTGSITQPLYREDTATGAKAKEQHQIGFTYIDITNNNIFDAHPIEATSVGNFQLDTDKYHNGKLTEGTIPAYVLGDLHNESLNRIALNETMRHMHDLNPKEVFMHDVFDGATINHHEAKSFLGRIRKGLTHTGSLEDELTRLHKTLVKLCDAFPQSTFNIVESNHDEFIRRYVDSQQFLDDGQNVLFTARMIEPMIKTRKPSLLIALETLNLPLPVNIKFLTRNDEVRIRGVLFSAHGHQGINGARGNWRSFERVNARAVTGHEHSPRIYSTGAVVGHLTDISKQRYAHGGLSSWLMANVYLDSYGKLHLKTLRSNFKQKLTWVIPNLGRMYYCICPFFMLQWL